MRKKSGLACIRKRVRSELRYSVLEFSNKLRTAPGRRSGPGGPGAVCEGELPGTWKRRSGRLPREPCSLRESSSAGPIITGPAKPNATSCETQIAERSTSCHLSSHTPDYGAGSIRGRRLVTTVPTQTGSVVRLPLGQVLKTTPSGLTGQRKNCGATAPASDF